jgi:hypothetical protein
MNSINTRIVARFYADASESGEGTRSSNSIDASPLTATCPVMAPTRWSLRFGEGLKNYVKYSLGFQDYKQAFDSIKLKPPVVTPNVQIVDTRPLGQRIGEFTGHMMKGISKTAMTGIFAIGAAALIGGSISNHRWPEGVFKISDFGPVHLASRHLAKGILELAKCVHQLGRSLGKAGMNGLLAALNFIANNPMVVFKMAGVGMVGYLTFRQIALASKEENYTRKAYHLSLATLGIVATLWLSMA